MLPAAITVILLGMVVAWALPSLWVRVGKLEKELLRVHSLLEERPLWRKI